MLNKSIIENSNFISFYTKNVLKNHCGIICNEKMFQELEEMCRNFVKSKVEEYENYLENSKKNRYSADRLIQQIEHHWNYANNKQSPKMRFTNKEYEQGMSLLNETEQNKVVSWLQENGGYDKYIVKPWNSD